MARGYWIGRIDAHDEAGFRPYAAANPAIIKKFGGRYVVRSGKFESVEGQCRSHNVVIEFPEYQENIKRRQPHSIADIVVIEGYDGPQP